MGHGFRRFLIFAIALMSGFAAYKLTQNPAPPSAAPIVAAPMPAIKLQKVIVAADNIPFGTRLTAAMLKQVDWPQDAMPEGSFSTKSAIIGQEGGAPVVLTALTSNEPVLPGKISRPGGRATLSSLIGKGMKAVTVRVDDVAGVAGFVLPGDMVDILVTRRGSEEGQADSYTDVLLQGVKVLAVDQDSNDKLDRPSPAKAVTLEVAMAQAQKVALGASIGKLSLALRQFGTKQGQTARRVGINELSSSHPNAKGGGAFAMVGITRGVERQEYKVPSTSKLN